MKFSHYSPAAYTHAHTHTYSHMHTHTLCLVSVGILRTILHAFVNLNSTAKCLLESQEESANMEALGGFNSDVPNLCPGSEVQGPPKYKKVTNQTVCQMGTVGLSSVPSHLPQPPAHHQTIHPRNPSLFIPKHGIQSPQTAKVNQPDKIWPKRLGSLVIKELSMAGVRALSPMWHFILDTHLNSEIPSFASLKASHKDLGNPVFL